MNKTNELKLPAGLSPEEITAASNLTENYVKAVMVLPDILTEMLNILQEINGSLGVMALYAEKKGLKDGLITDEDLAPEDKNAVTNEAN